MVFLVVIQISTIQCCITNSGHRFCILYRCWSLVWKILLGYIKHQFRLMVNFISSEIYRMKTFHIQYCMVQWDGNLLFLYFSAGQVVYSRFISAFSLKRAACCIWKLSCAEWVCFARMWWYRFSRFQLIGKKPENQPHNTKNINLERQISNVPSQWKMPLNYNKTPLQ